MKDSSKWLVECCWWCRTLVEFNKRPAVYLFKLETIFSNTRFYLVWTNAVGWSDYSLTTFWKVLQEDVFWRCCFLRLHKVHSHVILVAPVLFCTKTARGRNGESNPAPYSLERKISMMLQPIFFFLFICPVPIRVTPALSSSRVCTNLRSRRL